MSRGLSSAITDELAKGQFTMAHMISIETNLTSSAPANEAGNYFYTDASVDIQNKVSGQTEKFIYRANITVESVISLKIFILFKPRLTFSINTYIPL